MDLPSNVGRTPSSGSKGYARGGGGALALLKERDAGRLENREVQVNLLKDVAVFNERKRVAEEPLNKLKLYREICAELREMKNDDVSADDPILLSMKKCKTDAYMQHMNMLQPKS
jgi:hypothetical protein